jgi:hypothetical protein
MRLARRRRWDEEVEVTHHPIGGVGPYPAGDLAGALEEDDRYPGCVENSERLVELAEHVGIALAVEPMGELEGRSRVLTSCAVAAEDFHECFRHRFEHAEPAR